MRLPSHHHNQRGRLDVKMTPMIDVIFLLLVFFVCTASFRAIEGILPTNLSLSGSVESQVPTDPELVDLDEIVVKLFWQNGRPQWEINRRGYKRLADVRAVLAAAAQVRRNLPVILDVAGDVPLENAIDLYDLCRQIGLEKIRFAAAIGA